MLDELQIWRQILHVEFEFICVCKGPSQKQASGP